MKLKANGKFLIGEKVILHVGGERLMLTKELVEIVSREEIETKLGNQKALTSLSCLRW